jgi:hypothetical protein
VGAQTQPAPTCATTDDAVVAAHAAIRTAVWARRAMEIVELCGARPHSKVIVYPIVVVVGRCPIYRRL